MRSSVILIRTQVRSFLPGFNPRPLGAPGLLLLRALPPTLFHASGQLRLWTTTEKILISTLRCEKTILLRSHTTVVHTCARFPATNPPLCGIGIGHSLPGSLCIAIFYKVPEFKRHTLSFSVSFTTWTLLPDQDTGVCVRRVFDPDGSSKTSDPSQPIAW
jgi:hypothetical protein